MIELKAAVCESVFVFDGSGGKTGTATMSARRQARKAGRKFGLGGYTSSTLAPDGSFSGFNIVSAMFTAEEKSSR